jgi:hypothetical protein
MGGDEIGFVSHIFYDAFEMKAFLTPEKRKRNDFRAADPSARRLAPAQDQAMPLKNLIPSGARQRDCRTMSGR